MVQCAGYKDLAVYAPSGGNTLRHSAVYGRSRPKHSVSYGLMALAEHKSPEGNVLIESSQYALQHHSNIVKPTLTEYRLVAT
jgi:DNA-binding IclR family transcriptional regulator